MGHIACSNELTKQDRKCPEMYDLEYVRGHVEVYLDGKFCFSADTVSEAEAEIEQMAA